MTAVMFPFASKENKHIPDHFVSSIICELQVKGFHVVIPSGSPRENRLAALWCEQQGVTLWPQLPLGQLMPSLQRRSRSVMGIIYGPIVHHRSVFKMQRLSSSWLNL